MYKKSNEQWAKQYNSYYKKYFEKSTNFEMETLLTPKQFKEAYNEISTDIRIGAESKGSIINKIVVRQTELYKYGNTKNTSVTDFTTKYDIKHAENSAYVHFMNCYVNATEIANNDSSADQDFAIKWLYKYFDLTKWNTFKKNVTLAMKACEEIEELTGYTPT